MSQSLERNSKKMDEDNVIEKQVATIDKSMVEWPTKNQKIENFPVSKGI